jgi:hypothetical protein
MSLVVSRELHPRRLIENHSSRIENHAIDKLQELQGEQRRLGHVNPWIHQQIEALRNGHVIPSGRFKR